MNKTRFYVRLDLLTCPRQTGGSFLVVKSKKDEDIYIALKRKINEELNCTIGLFHDNTHEYENFTINLLAITAKIMDGTPTPNEHSKLIWIRRENLESLRWAPADIPAVKLLSAEK